MRLSCSILDFFFRVRFGLVEGFELNFGVVACFVVFIGFEFLDSVKEIALFCYKFWVSVLKFDLSIAEILSALFLC